MRNERKRWPVAVGLILCVLTLAASVLMQQAGYLGMLDGDIAADLLLAKRQAETGSLIQMDWLYSTEVRIFSPNLFYALAFSLGASFKWARILGNTLGLALVMASCVFALRKAKVHWGAALCASAMLAVSTGSVYAYVMPMGGFYLCHCILGFVAAGMWISAGEGGGGKKKSLIRAGEYALLCMLMGFFSVRYVLCFICPMMVVAGLEVLLAPNMSHSLHDRHLRLGGVTLAGFMACVLGYAASEIVLPRLFTSGVGAADTFVFGLMNGETISDMLFAILTDFLKLLGWRGEVRVFSISGMVNVCIGGVLALGTLMTVRVYRELSDQDHDQRQQKRMMQYAFAALVVNLLCFLLIRGTYLNRYLVLAVLFLVPVVAIVVAREKSLRLRSVFVLLLCGQIGLGSVQMFLDVYATEKQAELGQADMMDAAQALIDQGYTHGYGDFWDIRVMQERTQGRLTFAGIVAADTEEGAVCETSIDMIRWLEPADASHMDACKGKTFMILRDSQKETLAPWLALTGAPVIYENGTYTVYGFESSQQMVNWMLLAKMKLENAVYEDGVLTMGEGARMRVPTVFREAGEYALMFVCEGEPTQDSRASVYTTGKFIVTGEQAMAQGENRMVFELDQDDKYFIILLTGGQAQQLRISQLQLQKLR